MPVSVMSAPAPPRWRAALLLTAATPARARAQSTSHPRRGAGRLRSPHSTRTSRRAGFRVRTAYRTPLREAYLMALGHERTHTLMSLHAYGRALDVIGGDGALAHAATRAHWGAFRRWVDAYDGGRVRTLGRPARTWDWPHLEVPSAHIGFRSLDAALARARACVVPAPDGAMRGRAPVRLPCDFAPHLSPVGR